MKETPIIFSGPMVRAIREGRKTQTRRVVKTRPENHTRIGPKGHQAHIDSPEALSHCPYGQVGDRLWVRETFIHSHAIGGYEDWVDPNTNPYGPRIDIIYRADDGPNERTAGPWTSSIHMPRWASRIDLEVTGIRVERVQAISDRDARLEGCEPFTGMSPAGSKYKYSFQILWDLINGKKHPWESNPYVWVVEFIV